MFGQLGVYDFAKIGHCLQYKTFLLGHSRQNRILGITENLPQNLQKSRLGAKTAILGAFFALFRFVFVSKPTVAL